MKIAIAQLNPVLGDLSGNIERILDYAERAKSAGATLLVAPELALCGYPPEDLLFRRDFRLACAAALLDLAALTDGISLIVGHPQIRSGKLYNAASLLESGKVTGTYLKQRLPNYQVFDEKRYFETGDASFVFDHHGVKIGVLICEDVWFAEPVAATKAAVVSMTKAFAKELGSANVRSNAIFPGVVETKFASVLINTPEIYDRFVQSIPLVHVGELRHVVRTGEYPTEQRVQRAVVY